MLQSIFKIALRQLNKQRLFSFINISGLAVSLASCFLIISFVAFELSYDKHIDNYENIYRIQVDSYHIDDEEKQRYAVAYPSTGSWLVENFPEVIRSTRMNMLAARGVISVTDGTGQKQSFDEQRVFYTSPEYLDMFSIKIIAGDRETGLNGLDKALISQSMSKKYFGNQPAVGQTITRNGAKDFVISGVFEDIPENTHLKCDILLSYESLIAMNRNATDNWGWWDFYTYVELQPGSDLHELQRKVALGIQEKFPEPYELGRRLDLNFQPIASIHLNSQVGYEHEPNGSQAQVDFLIYIACFILLIAFINYINLSTAKSMERAKEVGVRKVMGSNKQKLIFQFMAESFVIIGLALLLGLTIYQLGKPIMEDQLGMKIPVDFYTNASLLVGILMGFLLLSLLAGFYPAFVLSGFSPIKVLSGRTKADKKGIGLRKALVLVQFACTTLLIAATIIVHSQLDFMLNSDLGIKIDQTLVVKGPKVYQRDEFSKMHVNFTNQLRSIPGVKSVSATSDIPGKEVEWSFMYEGVNPGDGEKMVRNLGIDEYFIEDFGIEILAGRGFVAEDHAKSWWSIHRIDSTFKNVILLNESAVDLLGFASPQDAVGKTVVSNYGDMMVIGVTKDFKYRTLKERPKELVMLYSHEFRSYYSIKMDMTGQSMSSLKDRVERFSSIYSDVFPGNPINYFFLDDFFNLQYESEHITRKLFSYFTIFALFIACLGMVGLSAYLIQQKRKEIGIRKVVGASVPGIFMLLLSKYLKLVLMAYIVAVPVSYYVMTEWLDGFVYHIEIGIFMLLLPIIVIGATLMITIGYQTLKAARANPIESLRYE